MLVILLVQCPLTWPGGFLSYFILVSLVMYCKTAEFPVVPIPGTLLHCTWYNYQQFLVTTSKFKSRFQLRTGGKLGLALFVPGMMAVQAVE